MKVIDRPLELLIYVLTREEFSEKQAEKINVLLAISKAPLVLEHKKNRVTCKLLINLDILPPQNDAEKEFVNAIKSCIL